MTESDQIARALDDAADRWPEDRESRGRLLLHLVEEGHRAIGEAGAEHAARRREAVSHTRGALTGTYAPGYLDRLRDDWPA